MNLITVFICRYQELQIACSKCARVWDLDSDLNGVLHLSIMTDPSLHLKDPLFNLQGILLAQPIRNRNRSCFLAFRLPFFLHSFCTLTYENQRISESVWEASLFCSVPSHCFLRVYSLRPSPLSVRSLYVMYSFSLKTA